jgi:alpha-L-fucosidase
MLRMSGKLTRRTFVRNSAATAALAHTAFAQGPANAFAQQTTIAAGPFQATYESLKQYKTPEWFRDAKFGIWAHWSAQCVPEQGDWYARRMYIQGDHDHDWNTEHYGHPSKFGFMEIDNLWRPDQWQPEQLMSLYQAAGAKYFFALANHHDNFDGVSNHSSHAWHWFQVAYGYDPVGPYANVRYDAYTLTKADGKGKWWDGLDPQDLYTGRNALMMPDGVNTIEAQNAWHKTHDGKWHEEDPPENPRFAELWYLRCKELLDKYEPDLLYFDDEELPLGDKGRRVTAHMYNTSIKRHGSLQSVVFAKKPSPEALGAFTLDIERSRSTEILAEPWQTDTCIGDWHYKRSIFEEHKYKTPETVISMLIDIISKNGNLLLSIPVRGNGAIDEDEHAFLQQLASWIPKHGEAIYGTRPYTVFGEGPPEPIEKNFSEKTRPHTAEDIRFTRKGNVIYAFVLAWPTDGKVRVKTMREGGDHAPAAIRRVEMIGGSAPLRYTQTADALEVTMPPDKPNPYAYVLRITT